MKNNPDLQKLLHCAIADIKEAERLGNKGEGGPVAKLVAENGYFYGRKTKELIKELGKLKKLPGRDGIPYIFSALWRHFKEKGFEYRGDTLTVALRNYDCSSYELDMLGSVINAAAVLETGLICREALRSKGPGGVRLEKALRLLKTVEKTDFTPLYPALSISEKLLTERERYYDRMTEGTKGLYRQGLRKYAEKKRITEKEAVPLAEKEAERQHICLGQVLGVDRRTGTVPYLLTALAFLALLLFGTYMLCPIWALILLFVPLCATALSGADFCFSMLKGGKPCPALDPRKLPEGVGTLTVITTLLSKDHKVFGDLERLYHTNRGEGMLFGVLADLPGAKSETVPEDYQLIKEARARIEGLNKRFGNSFCLFIRRRFPNGEGEYCGRERKRGALEDLVRYIKGDVGGFAIVDGADCRAVKYLLTLDGDTNLPPEGAATLTGMMLHPLNAPVIKHGKVKKGYGIIQPAVQPCLNTLGKTRFSALLTGVGGLDVYESAAFNRQQSVFGEGIFCGKGIIDINAYHKVLDGALPEGRVLSHDMPEGNILRTRYVSELSFTDSVPTGVLPYFGRLHRWIRGDVQNLSLLNGYGQGARGGFRIVCNVLRHLCPVLSFAALLLAGFLYKEPLGLWVCFFALLNLISPLFYTIISRPAALRFRARRFFSAVQSGIWQSIRTVFFETCSLCHKAIITLDACFKAVYRLFRGKKLLKWLTSAQAEKGGDKGIGVYIYRLFTSALVGSACFFFTGLWVTRLLGLLWFFFPVYAFYLSGKLPTNVPLSVGSKRLIKSRAQPIWRFFEDNVNEGTDWLPPDNIQYAPVEAVAMRTSPTNIGLYLLSVISAVDFGFIDEEEGDKRINAALCTIEAMPKWHGHLYNWYSLGPVMPIGGNYVSTVDSGNLCVCLVALSRYLYSGGKNDLAARAEALFEQADFTRLYNSKRNLFAIGVDSGSGKMSDSCYDLYMSEARSTSYLAMALGQVPIKHYRSLGRPVVGSGGHIGMASWSGTAFEYFMPQLFLPLYKDSFIYESLSFALYEQRHFGKGRLWGISESAYYCFDGDMNYQYKAHGIQSLALTDYREKELILSPYSVYLTLCLAPKEALKTLGAYESAGMEGKYGLYEAIDFTVDKRGVPVQSYMAHHMGMSLVACANACFDNIFTKRFMNHPKIGAFYELLQEKIPINAVITDAKKQKGRSRAPMSRGDFTGRLTDFDPLEPIFHLSGRGSSTIVADSAGHVRFALGGLTVNETHFDPYNAVKSLNVCFVGEDGIYRAAPDGRAGKFSFECAGGYCTHICSSNEFSGSVKYYTDPVGSFVTETKSDGGKSYSLVFGFDVQLCEDKEFYAHPAFNRLFISAEQDKTTGTLIFTKNKRDGKGAIYMAVGCTDADMAFEFETSKEGYGAYTMYRPENMVKPGYSCSTGVCVNPFCLIKTPPVMGGRARFIVSLGHSRRECVERLCATRSLMAAPGGMSLYGERENDVFKAIFCGRPYFAEKAIAKEGTLWARGISGDYPIIAVLVREFYRADGEFYVSLFSSLATLNIRVELVFLICEEDRYNRTVEKALRTLLTERKLGGFLGRRGGIFFADGSDGDTVELFRNRAAYFAESYDTPFNRVEAQDKGKLLPPIIREVVPCPNFEGDEGYTVDKGKPLAAPYSYILSGRQFGAVVTQSSLGYSFYANAALCRIAAFEADPYGGTDGGEVLYAFIGDRVYDLCACAGRVRYHNGVALYRGVVGGRAYSLTVFVCHKLPLKAIKVEFEDGLEADIAFSVKPLMGSGCFYSPYAAVNTDGGVFFENAGNSFFDGLQGFLFCLEGGAPYTSRAELFNGEKGAEDIVALRHKGKGHSFLLGAAPSQKAAFSIKDVFVSRGFDKEKEGAEGFAATFLPPVKLCTQRESDLMFNRFAPYQVAACRFFARGAFYQSGGAYGFRDQLQDCMFLVYSLPHTVRCHLIRAAARQYTDGSVQHWWHPCKRGGQVYGVKTKCSDDYLWLPLVVADYIEKTGDRGILDVQLPYLDSPPLGNEKERYEGAKKTGYTESLREHCERALAYGKRYGRHGLPLMGSCDWNDAFSDLGEGAESVFCAFLYVLALRRFGAICPKDWYEEEAAALLKRAEETFTAGRFVRAYDGNGMPLGVEGRRACRIDMLVQAFAVFAGVDREKCRLGLRTAFEHLYDRENKLMRLFTPAFGRDTEYAGYINAYAKGIRENGGQYTHAAVWFAAACALCGMDKEAAAVLDCVNPMVRAEDPKLFAKYKGEPYAIAADIYRGGGREGRMGWSHYTGAAGWYCKTVLEVFMGIELKEGFTKLYVRPRMEYEATLGFKGSLHIKATRGASLLYDGKEVSLPIVLEDGEHSLSVPLVTE